MSSSLSSIINKTIKSINLIPKHLSVAVTNNQKKNYGTNTYSGDGKTKVSILNNEQDAGLMINTFSRYGFRLNNNLKIMGPMAIFSRSVLSWNIEKYEDINENTLSLFCVLEPKIDVLVLGLGDEHPTPAFIKMIMEFMRKYKINVEILRTEQACATFNFLNSEHRMVAAALLPPTDISINEDDMFKSQVRNKIEFSFTKND